MDPIVEPDENYSDYNEEILNDPELGFPNGNFVEIWNRGVDSQTNLVIFQSIQTKLQVIAK